MFIRGNDKQLDEVIDKVAKDITYQNFCNFFTEVKRNTNEFFIVSNKKIAKYRSSKVATRTELFKELEKLYIDNIIYLDEISDALKNQYSSKNIKEEDLESFKKLKSELLQICKGYKEVLDGMENGLRILDTNLYEKIEQEKQRREQEKLEAEKRRIEDSNRSKDDDDDDYHSSSSHDDYEPGGPMNPLGMGPGIFGPWF